MWTVCLLSIDAISRQAPIEVCQKSSTYLCKPKQLSFKSIESRFVTSVKLFYMISCISFLPFWFTFYFTSALFSFESYRLRLTKFFQIQRMLWEFIFNNLMLLPFYILDAYSCILSVILLFSNFEFHSYCNYSHFVNPCIFPALFEITYSRYIYLIFSPCRFGI